MNILMNNNKRTYKAIKSILNEIEQYSQGGVISCIQQLTDDHFNIWRHRVVYPNSECQDIYFALPNIECDIAKYTNELMKYVSSEMQSENYPNVIFGLYFVLNDIRYEISSPYFIIDCFNKFKGSNVISAKSFYLNFFLNIEGYKKSFINGIESKNIEELYIERDISFYNDIDNINNSNNDNLESAFQNWVSNGKESILLLGDRGIGKSWSVKKFCIDNYKKHEENPWINPLPIYINLRKLSEGTAFITNLTELLFYFLKLNYECRIFGDNYTLTVLLKMRKIILVLDGLDEMSKEVNSEITLKNLWQLFELHSIAPKLIITSRMNFFSSNLQIQEHFAYDQYLSVTKGNDLLRRTKILNKDEMKVRKNFNIWLIYNLKYINGVILKKYEKLNDTNINRGISKIKTLVKERNNQMGKELLSLLQIPGFHNAILNLLGATKRISMINIYELSINNGFINYNIETDRAIDKFSIINESNEIIKNIFDINLKNKILRELSWYMLERDFYEFDIKEFPKFLEELCGYDYEIVINDLQSQTLLTLNKSDKYSFISNGIFAYYIASYLFNLINSDVEMLRGLRCIGKYSFKKNLILEKVSVFLSEKIKMLDSQKKREVANKVKFIYRNDRPYSPWLKYLSNNLLTLGLHLDKSIEEKDYWIKAPIKIPEKSPTIKLILVPGRLTNNYSMNINPFLISANEITNKDFEEFLHSDMGELWKRYGPYWVDGDKYRYNLFRNIINDYHLSYWIKGEIPHHLHNHPIVYVSWFTAAYYCNWLSKREGIPESKFYYNFICESEFIKVVIRENSCAYRLPSASEWEHAAREGNYANQNYLEQYINEHKNLTKEGLRIKNKLLSPSPFTNPVRSDAPNMYGIYGLIGNVREWVNKGNKNVYLPKDFGSIKGHTWLHGVEGLKYRFISEVYAENTNIDVGFRVAKSLKPDEIKKVKKSYSNFN
jgi:formylglycine-generating enzyme required for sulfatase activity